MLKSQAVVLFQGDSITDALRCRESLIANEPAGLGNGYARYAAAMLLDQFSHLDLQIHNRGVSGNKVVDLATRWQMDCLDLKPDVLSILIGVNDTLHGTGRGKPIAVTIEAYDRTYRQLLDQAKEVNSQIHLVLCQPFVLRCGAVDDHWFPEMTQRQEVVHRIATDYGAALVDFQAMFDAAIKEAEPAYWAPDGIHPSIGGHMRMAQTWIANCQLG